MKRIHKLICLTLVLAGAVSVFASCKKPDKGSDSPGLNPNVMKVMSDSLYVRKVDNLPEDFIMGMDASAVPSLEESGVKYYDFDGSEKDVYEILSDNGINYIRVRIWNDPYNKDGMGYGGGNCDIDNAIEIGKRATKYGMKLLVNFHYSDFWADPAKQMAPKAWKDMDSVQMSEALYDYTKESLERLVKAGVDIGMVQIGNETNGYLCGFKGWVDIARLMKAGCKATREVCPDALVAIHFANPEKASNYKNYGYYLASQQVDYDVFASSYYPAWHGTLENLANVLNDIADTYGKKTMVIETSYSFTEEDTDFYGNTGGDGVKKYPFTIQGQTNHMVDLIDAAANQIKNCVGVCYWEGTWISVGGESWEENSAIWERYGSGWASSYSAEYDPDDAGKYYGGCAVDNQAFFDKNGKAIESLKVFALVRKGNIVENKPDAVQDVDLIVDLNGDIKLPETVNAVMLDDSKEEIPVVWEKMGLIENYEVKTYTDINYDTFRNGGVAKYEVIGKAGGMTARCYVSMVEYNFLKNWSFEDDDKGTGWDATAIGSIAELKLEDKVSDSLTGTKHYHFWNGGTLEFNLEQTVEGLKADNYKFSMSTMGGDMGSYEAYIYVKINGEIVAKADAQFTVYNEWHTATINNFEVQDGDTVTVGIYVKAAGSGNGAWGKIDDALFNSVKEK